MNLKVEDQVKVKAGEFAGEVGFVEQVVDRKASLGRDDLPETIPGAPIGSTLVYVVVDSWYEHYYDRNTEGKVVLITTPQNLELL